MKPLLFILLIPVLLIAGNKTADSQADTTTIINLDICIKAALDYSPGLKEGFAQAEIKSATILKAKSSQYPYLYADASCTLTNQNKSGDNYNSASYGINTNQVLWQYGKNKALIKQSEFLYQAELSNFNALQQDVIVRVKQLYFEYLKYLKLLNLSKNNIEQVEIFLKAAQEKKVIGIGKNSDILKAEADMADAGYILNTYENYILKVRNELNGLTGLNITGKAQFPDELFTSENKYSGISSDSLYSMAKSNYPELKVIDQVILSQEAYSKSIKADMFPKIGAGAGYNWYYNPLFKDIDYWNAGLSISWNIFSGYQKKYQLKIEKLQKDTYLYQKENLLISLNKEINNQLLSLNDNYQRIKIIETLLKSTTENLNIVLEEYKQGISSMLELANARTENFNAKEKYINAWYAFQISKIQLERTIGITNK